MDGDRGEDGNDAPRVKDTVTFLKTQ
jgi:hypothetical protein